MRIFAKFLFGIALVASMELPVFCRDSHNAVLSAAEKAKSEAFVKTKGHELIELISAQMDEKDKFNKLLDFVHANCDTNAMARSALSGVYRIAGKNLTQAQKARLEEKVVKYLCSTYVNLTKDNAKNSGNFELSVLKTIKIRSMVIVFCNVKFAANVWKVNVYFGHNGKPYDITFDNVSVLDRNAFLSLFNECNRSIERFEKRLDSLIISAR